MKAKIISALLVTCRSCASARDKAGMRLEWSDLLAARRLDNGEVVAGNDGQVRKYLRIKNFEDKLKQIAVVPIESSSISARNYAVRGLIHHHGIQPHGYLDS